LTLQPIPFTSNIVTLANVNVNGQALMSASSPVVLPSDQTPLATRFLRQYYNDLGKAFIYYSGKQTAPGASTLGFQLFNPAASGLTLRLFSIQVILAAAGYIDIRRTTANVDTITGWTDSVITPSNDNTSSAITSAMTCSLSNTNVTGTLLGTSRSGGNGTANLPAEFFTNGEDIIIPSAAGINGIVLYLTLTGATVWEVIAKGAEY
jgi:hypothetical protein